MAKKAITGYELNALVGQTDLRGVVIHEVGSKFMVTNNGKPLIIGDDATFAGGTLKQMLQGYVMFQGLGEKEEEEVSSLRAV